MKQPPAYADKGTSRRVRGAGKVKEWELTNAGNIPAGAGSSGSRPIRAGVASGPPKRPGTVGEKRLRGSPE